MQQTGLKYGIITGIGTALYLYVFYSIDKGNAINPFVNLGSLLVVVIGMVMACVRQRSDNDGKLSRKEALKTSFTVAIFSGLFFYGFMYLLFKYIDPSLNELLQQQAATAEPSLQNRPYELSLANVVMGYAFSLIYGFLLSLMVAYFLKR
jgi:hypothetical protein